MIFWKAPLPGISKRHKPVMSPPVSIHHPMCHIRHTLPQQKKAWIKTESDIDWVGLGAIWMFFTSSVPTLTTWYQRERNIVFLCYSHQLSDDGQARSAPCTHLFSTFFHLEIMWSVYTPWKFCSKAFQARPGWCLSERQPEKKQKGMVPQECLRTKRDRNVYIFNEHGTGEQFSVLLKRQ